jgi:Phage integrase, N-terminal SAM-like domain
MGLSVSALPVPADVGAPVTQTGLGAAAERYARLTLRKSAQTQATYMSTYRRFAAWLAEQSGHPDPPPAALTADVVADYITELERKRAPATVKKERAAINRLTKVPAHGRRDRRDRDLDDRGLARGSAARRREALDAATWRRVKDVGRARLHQGARGRTSAAAAHRDLALVLHRVRDRDEDPNVRRRACGSLTPNSAWLRARRRRWCPEGALPVLCVVHASQLERVETGVRRTDWS